MYENAVKKEDYKRAIAYIEEAKELDPYYPLYYYYLGFCYYALSGKDSETWEEKAHCWRLSLECYRHVFTLQDKVYIINNMELLALVRGQIEHLEEFLRIWESRQTQQLKKPVKKDKKIKPVSEFLETAQFKEPALLERIIEPGAYVWREDVQKYRCEYCKNVGEYHYFKTLSGFTKHYAAEHM